MSRADRVMYLTLNRPEKLNAINYQIIGNLLGYLDEVGQGPGDTCGRPGRRRAGVLGRR